MAVAGDVLLDPLREAVGLRAIPSAAEDVEIVPGELGQARRVPARWRSCSMRRSHLERAGLGGQRVNGNTVRGGKRMSKHQNGHAAIVALGGGMAATRGVR